MGYFYFTKSFLGEISDIGWYLLPVGAELKMGLAGRGDYFLAKIFHPYSLLLFSEGIYIQG